MTLKNNRAPLLSNIKLYASFHHHMWIQTGVTVRKRLSWVVTSVTLTFDLWPWPFAWTLLLSLVITPENFMMIRWWEHSQKGVTDRQTDRRTDGQTDGQTENTICRAAWSQLKTHPKFSKNRIPPKSNQVMTMTRGIKPLSVVVIGWVILTLSCRKAYFCLSMSQPWPWVKVNQMSSSTFSQTYTLFVPNI